MMQVKSCVSVSELSVPLFVGDFILEFLVKNGAELPNHITSVLSTLICRITSLSWMVDVQQRNILDLLLKYTESRENCILALTVLEELVNQISPTSLVRKNS